MKLKRQPFVLLSSVGSEKVSKSPEYACVHRWNWFIQYETCLTPISTQSSSAHVEERDQELWGTLEQDCLWLVSAKNNKSVSDCSIQVCTGAVECAAYLACERFFPRKCWSKHDRPILDFSDAKTTFARLIRQNYWIFQFSNKIA